MSTSVLKKSDFNKSYFPKIPVEDVFFNKRVDLLNLEPESKKVLDKAYSIIKNKDYSKFIEKPIEVNKIYPTQKFLNFYNLEKIKIRNNSTDAELVKFGDKYYILDGHHRIAREILNGEDIILANVYDSNIKENMIIDVRNLIKVVLYETFENYSLLEDYPTSFDMEYFKTLNSFSDRIRYCEQNLQRISSGSSRIVYKIDDEKVLKLAKNKKGLAQNETEALYSSYKDLDYVLARVYDYNEDYLWIEMQLARKITPSDFKRITGFSFEDFAIAVHNYGIDSGNGFGFKKEIDKSLLESMWEDEFVFEIFQYIGNYGVPSGDLTKKSSYGIVKEDGDERVIIIDYGLTSDVYGSYYN